MLGVQRSMQDLAPFFSRSRLVCCSESPSRSGARWAHHNPTTTVWRSTAVGDLQKPLREYGLRRPMVVKRRIPVGSENHGVPVLTPLCRWYRKREKEPRPTCAFC